MEANSEFLNSEILKFNNAKAALLQLRYSDSEDFRRTLGSVLDELNSIEYSLNFVQEQVVGDILAACCHLVPLIQEPLVSKVCHLVYNAVARQQIVLESSLNMCVEYVVEGLRVCPHWLHSDLLKALAALLYENVANISKFHEILIGRRGLLQRFVQTGHDDEVKRVALQCIENICIRPSSADDYLSGEQYENCFVLFLTLLHTPKASSDPVLNCRILASSLRGIQNILLATKFCHPSHLSGLLSALKVYMVTGLPGMQNKTTLVLPRLYPTPVSQYDPNPQESAENTPEVPPSPNRHANARTSARKTKKKKGGKSANRKASDQPGANDSLNDSMGGLNISQDFQRNISQDGVVSSSVRDFGNAALYSPFPTGSRMYSSDSEYSGSDVEGGGQASRLRSHNSKVRHCALACFHAVIKATKKRDMFGYWTSFLPDSPGIGGPPQGQTLFTTILKDPSPKGRTGALAVLTALLDGSKKFLVFAEDRDVPSVAFTPFSVTLGYMIREIHRCLLLALVSENSPLATTQIIKCLATLIPNVPYQRMKPGLLSKVVRQIKPFLGHRDPNIRVACLTCLGAIVSISQPLMEVWTVLHPGRHQRLSSSNTSYSQDQEERENLESGYQSSHSDRLNAPGTPGTSGNVTPKSGTRTPMTNETDVNEPSWVVRMCVKNTSADLGRDDGDLTQYNRGQENQQPLPVRLESLQLLAMVSKKYFPLIRNCLRLICDLVQRCLQDPDPSVQLHGSKLLEEVGSTILRHVEGLDEAAVKTEDTNDSSLTSVSTQPIAPLNLDLSQALEFWLYQLNGPLPTLLQNPVNQAVRATGCDAISNIGPKTFAQLPTQKRILCITLLLGLTNDDDHHVRAGAVRALGVYVLYPSLRDDVCFVADVANAILNTLEEDNINVKIRAAWALGNLSDALVLNNKREGGDEAFLDDFSDMLLLKLLDAATRRAHDNDKVKSNAVRALGNLLRYLPQRSYSNSRFVEYLDQAVQALIKNVGSGTMKVRWNACYAVSNMFHNHLLLHGNLGVTTAVQQALCNVVRECKNFKVRINAALAFSIPANRGCYGNPGQFLFIWDSLLVALENAEQVTDFAEYRYRDNFTEQVIRTFSHLLGIIDINDVEPLAPVLGKRQELLIKHTERYKQIRSSLHKSPAILSKATSDHMLELLSVELSDPQKATLTLIQDIFITSPDATKESPGREQKFAFSQTYD